MGIGASYQNKKCMTSLCEIQRKHQLQLWGLEQWPGVELVRSKKMLFKLALIVLISKGVFYGLHLVLVALPFQMVRPWLSIECSLANYSILFYMLSDIASKLIYMYSHKLLYWYLVERGLIGFYYRISEYCNCLKIHFSIPVVKILQSGNSCLFSLSSFIMLFNMLNHIIDALNVQWRIKCILSLSFVTSIRFTLSWRKIKNQISHKPSLLFLFNR